MLIVAVLYVGLIWLLFFKLRVLPWTWPWRIASGLVGTALLLLFLGLLNYLAPTGRIVVAGRVVEVTANVAGPIVAVEVRPDIPVEAGAVLFRIDPTTFEASVRQLKAGLAEAEQRAKNKTKDRRRQTDQVDKERAGGDRYNRGSRRVGITGLPQSNHASTD